MGVKIFRNGRWEEVDGGYEDNLRTRYVSSDAPLFVEMEEGFSAKRIAFSLQNNEHTLTGYVVFSTSSILKANSKYYIGRLFPQLRGATVISYIYNCTLCQDSDKDLTYLPAVICIGFNGMEVSIIPLSTTAANYAAEIEINFNFNFNQKLNSNYIEALFN